MSEKNKGSILPYNLMKKVLLFAGGIDVDTSKQLSGGNNESEKGGRYLRAKNARLKSLDGNQFALEKIKGESVKWQIDVSGSDYRCIGSTEVNTYLFQCWADRNSIHNPLITIDGSIVANNINIPFLWYDDLCIAKDENKLGGEVYITNGRTTPIYLYIDELLNPSPSTKFTTSFNLDVHTINIKVPINIAVFEDLEEIGFGGGLPTGQYSYSIRYSSKDGDRSNWSVPTPMIFVPRTYLWQESENAMYPFIKTKGSDPDTVNATAYGIRLKFRVDNIYNYDFIEIKRISYNKGEGLGFRPNEYIVKKIPINQNQFSVIYYTDGVSNQDSEITIALDDTQNNLSFIEKAKTVRYCDNKVVFGDVTYTNRIVNDEDVTFRMNGDDISFFSIIKDLGEQGMKKINNHVNFKPLLNSEEYGWGIVFYDSNNQSSYVTKLKGFQSYEMPSRRDPMTDARSIANSENPTNCADVNGNINDTFECVDYSQMRRKYTLQEKSELMFPSGETDKRVLVNIAHTDASVGVSPNDFETGTEASYRPLRPINQTDSEDTYDYNLCDTVYSKTGSDGIENANSHDYRPHGFAPRYKSLGMCLAGLLTYPEWATSFSIVRTKAAGKVICQGMGFYSIIGGRYKSGGNPTNVSWNKKKNALICQFPDIENGFVSSSLIESIIKNPTGYKIQLVAPYGFFTEPYHFNSNPDSPFVEEQNQFDMISYARVQEEKGNFGINPFPDRTTIGINDAPNSRGVVRYGKWMNPNDVGGSFSGGSGGNQTFDITSIKEVTEKGPYRNLEIIVSQDIYANDTQTTRGDTDDTDVKNLHEPVYIVNIIKIGSSVQDKEFQDFKYTGNYTKLKSVVGYGNGIVGQKYEIVDERLEDFHCTSAVDRFIWIDEELNGVYKRWINTTNKTPLEIAAIDILIASGVYGGKYISTEKYIQFIYPDNIPALNSVIQIRYNNAFPVKVFGGDASVGESTMIYYNRVAGGEGKSSRHDHVFFNQAFPYRKWLMDERYYICKKASSISRTNAVQDVSKACISNVRNFGIVYTCQSRTSLVMAYGDFFPNVHYVVRPLQWQLDSGSGSNVSNVPVGMVGLNRDNVVFRQYYDDRPEEWKIWTYGGIKGSIFPINLDYSKECEHFKLFSRPSVGFEEHTIFHNRVLWSQTRPISSYNQPSLKTFRPFNFKDIEDNFGEIEKLWSCKSESGYNLYAFCRDNICLLLTRKNILLDASGKGLATSKTSDDTYIGQTIWIGDSEMKGLQSLSRNGFTEFGDSAIFFNRISVYKFINNKQIDILDGIRSEIKNNILKKLSPDSINDIRTGTIINCIYDSNHKEYWMQVGIAPDLSYNLMSSSIDIDSSNLENNLLGFDYAVPFSGKEIILSDPFVNTSIYLIDVSETSSYELVVKNSIGVTITTAISGVCTVITWDSITETWSSSTISILEMRKIFSYMYVYQDSDRSEGFWISQYDYHFDKYCFIDNVMYGSRHLTTYKLNTGFKINNESILYQVQAGFNTRDSEEEFGKEFKRIRVNSNNSPSSIDIFKDDNIDDVVSVILESTLKNRNGFEQDIPKESVSRKRVQGVNFSFRINHNKDESFYLNSVTIQYFMLK